MAIRMMSGLPARVIQVLIDYLPTETALIDAEEADGITTPTIATGAYYEWDRRVIPGYTSCSILPVSSIPIQVLPYLMGTRVDAYHRLDVMFHVVYPQAATSDPLMLQKLLFRYIAGAARVLCVRYEALQTVADPTRYAELVEWAADAVYGPEDYQESGAIVRTATLPINVRMRESR